MKIVLRAFSVVHAAMAALFALVSLQRVAVGVVLAGWGLFVRLDTAAEAMADAKREDRELA